MITDSIKNIINKISETLQVFFKQEELIKKRGKEIVKDTIKKSNDQKIEELKKKIEKM